MIERLKEAAKVAWRVGRERQVFLTIEIEPAGVCVRGCGMATQFASTRATWAQIEENPDLLLDMVAEVVTMAPSEVA